jgi:integral membrane protein (TIGR01906 family)
VLSLGEVGGGAPRRHPPEDYDARVIAALARRFGIVILALAVALVVVVVSILPFLNPIWVSFEQGRAEAAAWTGYTPVQVRTATDAILSDLILGPPRFDVTIDGQPVLNERERSHMADVRSVFGGFAALALIATAVIVIGWLSSRRGSSTSFHGAVRAATTGLAVAVLAVGVVGLAAFDVAFEIFHRLFFAGGTYTFDPRTDRLVQLFPVRFWLETSAAVGLVILVLCAIVWRLAGRHAPQHVPPVDTLERVTPTEAPG